MSTDISRDQTPPGGRGVAAALWRKRYRVLIPTAGAAALLAVAVNVVTPQYRSEARILVLTGENPFLRMDADRAVENPQIGTQAMQSQVQLVLSRDLAGEVIDRLKLRERPEFTKPPGILGRLRRWVLPDPHDGDRENERVLQAFVERLAAYTLLETRVLTIEFRSEDPDLAAAVTNAVADAYLERERTAKRDQALAAAGWLLQKIDGLREEVAAADLRAQEYRSGSDLAYGQQNTTLSGQQLSELTSQYSALRAEKSAAEATASSVRAIIASGGSGELPAALNSRVIRTLMERRATLHAYLARQSSTLLDHHPQMARLRAQLAEVEDELRREAAQAIRTLDQQAAMASARLTSLEATLAATKSRASDTNAGGVELRARERDARARRDLLESYLAKYREATVRNTVAGAPTEGRIMSRAVSSHIPVYPKKTAIVGLGTVVVFLMSFGVLLAGEVGTVSASAAGGSRRRVRTAAT